MDIEILASGSTGNAYIVSEGEKSILIECGLTYKKLMELSGYRLSGVDFCIISHEHKDHCKAWEDMCSSGITMAMSEGTYYELVPYSERVYGKRITVMYSEKAFKLKGWRILPFSVQHDAADPVGFLIESPGGRRLCYATDTYYIKYNFVGVHYWMVECNYSEELLEKNDINEYVKHRIRMSHFEYENVKTFFTHQDLSNTEAIYLIHLSSNNSDETLFRSGIEAVTGKHVYT